MNLENEGRGNFSLARPPESISWVGKQSKPFFIELDYSCGEWSPKPMRNSSTWRALEIERPFTK